MTRARLAGMVLDRFAGNGANEGSIVVFLNGFPGAVGPLPAVLSALSNGFPVVSPIYPGTYDSEGLHGIKSTALALSVFFEALQADYRDVRVIAHSFGAFHLINALRAKPCDSVTKCLLLAPMLSYGPQTLNCILEDLSVHLQETIGDRPFTYRIDKEDGWKAAAEGLEAFEQSRPWLGDATILFGDQDDSFEPLNFEKSAAEIFSKRTGCKNVQVYRISGAGHAMHQLLRNPEMLKGFYGK